MKRISWLSSSSVMSSRWPSAHISFTDFPDMFSRMKSLTLSSRSTSDGLHGGSAFGVMHSVSSKILALTQVMQVVNLVLGFFLHLFDLLNGGSGGVVGVFDFFDLGRLGTQ